METPSYLRDFDGIYGESPKQAALEWFNSAGYGLFIHYGLYSLLGRGEWVQYHERIPVDEYETLKDQFTADGFDADAVARFALECGMKYVNITTRHHDSFCLFDTDATNFNSKRVVGRDLIAEMSEACDKYGLGLCLYYSHGRDWRHPHAPNNDEWGGSARPEYSPPEPSYKYGKEHDLSRYVEFMRFQVKELLTNYGAVAAIWLDGIAVPMSGDADRFECDDLYAMIRSLQPHTLVSYKQGLTGGEDFFAPEHRIPDADNPCEVRGRIDKESRQLIEVCTTMSPGIWGYVENPEGEFLDEDGVLEKVRDARGNGYNLLLNIGLPPDGSLPDREADVMRRAGERMRSENA